MSRWPIRNFAGSAESVVKVIADQAPRTAEITVSSVSLIDLNRDHKGVRVDRCRNDQSRWRVILSVLAATCHALRLSLAGSRSLGGEDREGSRHDGRGRPTSRQARSNLPGCSADAGMGLGVAGMTPSRPA